MKRNVVVPSSKEEWLKLRSEVITSTEVSALFGCSPYITEFELFYQKKNKSIVTIDENERMKWGSRLQDSIAIGVAEDYNWQIRKMEEFISVPEIRIGSSFDYMVNSDSILEIKNVDYLQYKEKWIDDGINLEAPPHIELQLQHQMLVAQKQKGFIVALVAGNQIVKIEREANSNIQASILMACSRFWKRIENDDQPEINFERDASTVIEMYSNSNGKTISVGDDVKMLALEYKTFSDAEKNAKEKKEQAKAKILSIIQDNEKAIGDGFSISAGVVAATDVSFRREAYRNFRVNIKKG